MKRDRRFLIGLGGVAVLLTYLVWTGVSDTMVYYLTPAELVAQAAKDPALHQLGVKVGAKAVPGTYVRGEGGQTHAFSVHDIDDPSVTFRVEYDGLIPDTFNDEAEVVLDGRFREDGVFEATHVLTKCGSRYEATPDELAA